MTNVVITGAARGIGLEMTKQYAAAGDRVFAMVRDPENATALKQLASQSGGKVTLHKMDVADDSSVRAGAADIGSEPVDILFNVAGIVGPFEPLLEPNTSDQFDAVIEIMLKGPLRVLQAFLPRLGEGSKVINFSSQVGASTWPYGGLYPYVAAKAGLNRLMRSVAFDLKDRGIIVGLIHPGYVQTDMGGPDAEITPQESATGVRNVAKRWTIEHTGEFLKWNGETHPW